jgi:adhesin transport system outer membrane protein
MSMVIAGSPSGPNARRLLGAAVACLSLVWVDLSSAQSLRQTAQDAVRTHPRVDLVSRNREAVGQELARARGLFLPQIDLRVGGGPERSDNASTRARGGTASLTRRESGVFLTQRLFDGWETDSEVSRQVARTESAALRVGEAVELLALEAIDAHIDVFRQRRLLVLARQNVEALEAIVEKVRARAVDMIPAGEAEQANSRLDSAHATLIETRAALEEAESRYLSLVNRRPGPDLEAPAFPVASLRDMRSLDDLLDRARRNNRTLRITQSDIRVAEHEVEGTESAFYPKLSLEVGASRNRDVNGTLGDESDASALLVMRWNLYRGGADIAQRNVALGRMSQSIAQHHLTSRTLEEELRRSLIQLEAAEDRIPKLESARVRNISVRDTYQTQFLTRERSLLDVLNAENEVFVSSGRLVTAQSVQVSSAFRLLAATGSLVSAFELEATPEMDPARAPGRPADPRRAPAR